MSNQMSSQASSTFAVVVQLAPPPAGMPSTCNVLTNNVQVTSAENINCQSAYDLAGNLNFNESVRINSASSARQNPTNSAVATAASESLRGAPNTGTLIATPSPTLSIALSTGTHSNGSSSPKGQKSGLDSGAVAGVAIGMLLAGIIFAGIVFYFLLRRQKNRQYRSVDTNRLSPADSVTRQEKGPSVVAGAVPSSIDNLLPQPVSDDTMTGELSRIRDNMKNHIRTYCHSSPVKGGINEAALARIATAVGVSTSTLVGALSSPKTRQDALRLIFAWVVLSKATGGNNTSLLPANLAGLTSTLAESEKTTSHAALFSKWKTITSALYAQDPSRTQNFTSVIAELDEILAPFVQGSIDGGKRRQNLDMILGRSANFAFLLFSQPGSFVFDFSSPHGGIGMAVFPTFIQIIDDRGQKISPPRVLLERELVAV